MGTAAQYDIGEVVDGDFNVVARLPKTALRQIARPQAAPPQPGLSLQRP